MIDILPPNQRHAISRIRMLRIATVGLYALAIIVAIATILLIPTLITINYHFHAIDHQMTSLEASGAVVKPADVAIVDARVNSLAGTLNAQTLPTPMSYITTIRSHLVSGITITGYSLVSAGSIVSVSGVATTREALASFVASLETDAHIASVDSPVSNFVKGVKAPFTITITFKP